MKPLQGVKIVDLSHALPGPLCTQMLGDYGAEVIKVEALSGELGRTMTPLVAGNRPHYYNMNRNKKSLALNLKAEEGKEVFKKLISEADVLVEQYRPETMNKLGLGYEVLKEINPRLIYCAITGYGYSGPMKMTAGHDNNYLSLMGILSASGPKEAPGLMGTQVADIAGGTLHGAVAILMALRAREVTGKGQFCDVSMADGCSTMLTYMLADYWGYGEIPHRASNVLNGGLAIYNLYETSDAKWVSLGAIEPKFWASFCTRIGKEEFISQELMPGSEAQDAMIEELRSIMKTKTQDEWVGIMSDLDICFSPVLSLDQTIEDPQVIARELVIKVPDFRGTGKTALFPGLPIKLSDTPGEVKLEFSDLGEDTAEILRDLGYSDDVIQEYVEQGVLGV